MYCTECKQVVTSKFCPDCGSKPVEAVITRVCPNCNIEVTSKFCPDCGSKPVESIVITEGKRVMMCPNCNIEVTSRFCPECGAKPEERFVTTGGGEQSGPAPVQQEDNEVDGPKAWIAKGMQCKKNVDYEGAMEWYMKAVEAGDLDACSYIGDLYASGDGVDKDEDEALKWYKTAAEQGNARGIYKIADWFVWRDHVESMRWWIKLFNLDKNEVEEVFCDGAALTDSLCEDCWEDGSVLSDMLREEAVKGNAYAQYFLGICYQYGCYGLEEDEKEGHEWVLKSANQGFVGAMFRLFSNYYSGLYGDEKDLGKSIKWYLKGIQTGWHWLEDTNEFYSIAYNHKGDDTSTFDILEREVAKGNKEAMLPLAVCYACGYSVAKNQKAAMEYAVDYQAYHDEDGIDYIETIKRMINKDYY